MAYMNAEKKARLAPAIKAVLKKYGVSATLKVENLSTLVCNVRKIPADMVFDMNGRYYVSYCMPLSLRYKDNSSEIAKNFIDELYAAMNDGNHNRSDITTDYFDVGWYININIGSWEKSVEVI